MNKKILYISVVALVILAAAGIFLDSHREYPQSATQQEAISTAVSVNTGSTASTTAISEQNTSGNLKTQSKNQTLAQESTQTSTTSSTTVSSGENTHQIQISFVAGSTTYAESVPQGSTAYDAMAILASTTPSFNFKAAYYSGLGYFVQEINGIKNSSSMYWTLYINGAYSTVGASSYVVKNGDTVEWRFEK